MSLNNKVRDFLKLPPTRIPGNVQAQGTIADLARKHSVSLKYLIKQLLRGTQRERLFSSSIDVAMDKAFENLSQDPHYYRK